MAKTNSGLLAYAKAQVGLPYWYGTFGQTASASLYASKKKQYPDNYTADDFASQYGKRVHDCVGLIKGYLWSASNTATPTYNAAQDKSASGMYSAATTKGKIATFPGTDGLLVFKGTSVSKITHVGIYDDAGYVYEAKGHATGVVKTAYKASDWQFWAQCPYTTDDTTKTTTTTTATKSVEEVAQEVIDGKWGNGTARKTALTEAGYDYSAVQAKVNELLKSSSTTTTKAAATTTAEPKTIWDYLLDKIGNAYGVAGLMGNLYAESALIPNNLQNGYQTKLGYTDASYTAAVDDGTYTAFSSDSAGYGLAQWTYSTRKKNLLAYAESQNASIGNLTMQLGFLMKELTESYTSVLSTLKSATSVLEASNAVLLKFEKPANTGTSVQTARANYGQKYYDTYAGTSSSSSSSSSTSTTTKKVATDDAQSFNTSVAGTYKATANLNVRIGAGTGKSVMVTIPKGTLVKNYGYYTTANGVKWLYVQFTYKGIQYTGFCSSTYLSKT
ncbi:MAG: phage tail tip lysozyme [Clostridiales bacterium]|nr:phage tail tip lysozyme [Clostridiales bacterium]